MPIPMPDALLAAALSADFDAADFRSEPLRRLWGEEADDALARGLRHPILRALGDADAALPTLGRLLVLGLRQPAAAVAAALPRCGVDGLVGLGLAEVDGDEVVPAALVRPQSFVDADGVGEWWIASDLDEVALGGPLPTDHVLGVGGASRTLAELIMPTPVGRALDLGTGCGIQALLVARHAGEVVATDISARALAFAELNAQLNAVQNITFRQGSLFDPVANEAFDLIVSNPPFVITPRVAGVPDYEYRDGGLVGDALVEQFIREAPAHLTLGGAAQLLGNWESRHGVPGLARLESWVADGVDAWVIEREELSHLAYAELWIRDGGTLPRDAGFTPLLSAWLEDFATRGVDAIGFGYILLRRSDAGGSGLPGSAAAAVPPAGREPSGVPGVSAGAVPPAGQVGPSTGPGSAAAAVPSAGQVGPSALRAAPPKSPADGTAATASGHDHGGERRVLRRFERVGQPVHDLGRALAAGLAASDLLERGLPERLVVASDVTEARHFLPGSDDPSVIELRQGGGFGRTVSVDPALAGFVGACDGELTVAQIVAALADLFEVPLADLWADLEPRIGQLVLDGFLLPAL